MSNEKEKAMIELSYRCLNDNDFMQAVERLDNHTDFPLPLMVRFTKLQLKIQEEVPKLKTLYMKLVDKHSEKKEKTDKKTGEKTMEPKLQQVPGPDGKNQLVPVMKDDFEYQKDFSAMLEEKFTVEIEKFKVDEFGPVKIAPRQLRSIMPIMEDL